MRRITKLLTVTSSVGCLLATASGVFPLYGVNQTAQAFEIKITDTSVAKSKSAGGFTTTLTPNTHKALGAGSTQDIRDLYETDYPDYTYTAGEARNGELAVNQLDAFQDGSRGGLNIKAGFDGDAAENEYRWIQYINLDPFEKKYARGATSSPFTDPPPDDRDDTLPFYWTDTERATEGLGYRTGGDVDDEPLFSDRPRMPNSAAPRRVEFNLHLVDNDAGDEVATIYDGMQYGFRIRSSGTKKKKDISISETITKVKDITITLTADLEVVSATEAHSIANIISESNSIKNGAEPLIGFDGGSDISILDSVNDSSGIIVFNQDVGTLANQSFLLAVGEIVGAESGEEGHASLVDAQSVVQELNAGNQVSLPVPDDGGPIVISNGTALIDESVNDNTGIVGVNQNAGLINNQTHAISIAVNQVPGVALSDADLEQVNSGNATNTVGSPNPVTLQDSINGNSGIVTVNQAAGNIGNQAVVISFAGQANL